MKKISLDNEKCFGCGSCVAIDPEHFNFDNDTGLSKVISEKNIENNEKVNEAIDACPVGAIEFFETECTNENCTCNPCNCGPDCQCNDTK